LSVLLIGGNLFVGCFHFTEVRGQKLEVRGQRLEIRG
jgi:hypothetical protein